MSTRVNSPSEVIENLYPKIIALYSSTSGVGKTTFSKGMSSKFGYYRMSFASGVRDMAWQWLSSNPFLKDDGEARDYFEKNKDSLLPGIKFTYREFLIMVGSFGRECIDEDYWVWRLDEQLKFHKKTFGSRRLTSSGTPIIIDDLRFPNEYGYLNSIGATIIKVTSSDRPGTKFEMDGKLDKFQFKKVINVDTLDMSTRSSISLGDII
jgi:hypothetical protein